MGFNCIIIYSSFVIFLQEGVHLDPPHPLTFAPSFPLHPPPGHCRRLPGRAKAGETEFLGLGCGRREVEGDAEPAGFPLGFRERPRESGKLPEFGVSFQVQGGNFGNPEFGSDVRKGRAEGAEELLPRRFSCLGATAPSGASQGRARNCVRAFRPNLRAGAEAQARVKAALTWSTLESKVHAADGTLRPPG